MDGEGSNEDTLATWRDWHWHQTAEGVKIRENYNKKRILYDNIDNPSSSSSSSSSSATVGITFAAPYASLEATLVDKGYVHIGTGRDYLGFISAFIETHPFDTDLPLGCARREDSYAAQGAALAAPFLPWLQPLGYEYSYASIITAFPAQPEDQPQAWHRDTPDNLLGEDHQLTFIINLTTVTIQNGATEFHHHKGLRDPPNDEKGAVKFPGPPGDVSAFWSSGTWHRGPPNHTQEPRAILYVAFDGPEGTLPHFSSST